MRLGGVVDGLDGVEAQAIHMILEGPVAGVGDDEIADGTAAVVEGFAPGGVDAGEIFGAEPLQVVAIGPVVVIDDIENDGEVACVGGVDQAA